MESFEELALSSALVEALVGEGIERPTALQAEAIPVLRRGHSALLRGGPGAGILVAYGLPLLDRLEPGEAGVRALVLTSGRRRAGELALALARLSAGSEHRVAALGGAWAFPEHATILFATPGDLHRALRAAEVKLDRTEALVLDGADALLEGKEGGALSAILPALPSESLQIVVVAEPITAAVRRFVDQHMRRAVFIPPEAAAIELETGSIGIQRGTLRVRVAEEESESELVPLVAELLEEGAPHLLLFTRSEDRVADLADLLALHGFHSGPAGDPEVPLWLGVDPLEAREAIQSSGAGEGCVVVSVDVPTDPDDLDRRHGGPRGGGVVLALPRELPHLRRTAQLAGYAILPFPSPAGRGEERSAAHYLGTISKAMEEEDLLPHLLLLEPLIRERGAAEVAAALSALLRRKTPVAGEGARGGVRLPTVDAERVGPRPKAWVRLFLSVGERDGVGAGDLLGAIIGECGIAGDQVGKIELRDTFSKVEIQEGVADQVIRALNGTSIRGRSVRVDFDRGEGRAPRPSPPSGPRKGGGVRGKGGPRGGSRPNPRGGDPRGG